MFWYLLSISITSCICWICCICCSFCSYCCSCCCCRVFIILLDAINYLIIFHFNFRVVCIKYLILNNKPCCYPCQCSKKNKENNKTSPSWTTPTCWRIFIIIWKYSFLSNRLSYFVIWIIDSRRCSLILSSLTFWHNDYNDIINNKSDIIKY
jgi:hypothetical protein